MLLLLFAQCFKAKAVHEVDAERREAVMEEEEGRGFGFDAAGGDLSLV